MRLQRAWAVLRGVQAAQSEGALPAAWFDAEAADPSCARALADETNNARLEARLRRKGARGG